MIKDDVKVIYTPEELKFLSQKAHDCALRHGFYDGFVGIEESLWLVVTELAEMTDADRKGKRAGEESMKEIDEKELSDDAFKALFEAKIEGTVESEMADACIRLFDILGTFGFIPSLKAKADELIIYESLARTCYHIAEMLIDSSMAYKSDLTLFERIVKTLFYMFRFAESMGIDLKWFIEQKMRYNELRPLRNGKRY